MRVSEAAVARVGYKVAKDSFNCLKPHYDYVMDIDENFEKLVEETEALASLRTDIECFIQTQSYGRTEKGRISITNECDNLLRNVRKTEGKFKKFQKKYQETTKCLFGICPLFKLRKLGKNIVETTEEVVKRKNDLENLQTRDKLVFENTQYTVGPYQGTQIVELESLQKNVKSLMKMVGEVRMVGILGMEGVGKTTLLKKLEVEAIKNRIFDGVIYLSVHRNFKGDVLKQIKHCTHTTNPVSDDELFEKCIQERYLVLLDQVSSPVELGDIGNLESHTWKFVIASTKRTVCQSMGADEYFKVERLPENDVQTLFLSTVGPVIRRSPRLEEIAKLIVQEIGGMPGLTKAVATSLRGVDSEDKWNQTLRGLQSTIQSQQGHLQDRSNILNIIVDQLIDGKTCLLYVSLFPKDYKICGDYLVECWRVDSVLPEAQLEEGPSSTAQQPFRAARERGGAILEELISASLLERYGGKKHIRMPDYVRKQALATLRLEETILVTEAAHQRETYPPEHAWESTRRISLCNNMSECLPKKPQSSDLLTLFLQRNCQLKSIPNSFFSRMHNLHLLDLFKSGIQSLPPSMFSLIRLRGLYLNHCRQLVVLPAKIAKLKNLEVLDIRDTGIRTLPSEIGKLEKLKCFRVSFLSSTSGDTKNTSSIHNILHFWRPKKTKILIPQNVVKKLHQLEELTIFVDHKEESWNNIVNNVVTEMASLEVLAVLCFYFPSEESLGCFVRESLSWKNMEARMGFRAFKMIVGCHEIEETDKLSHSSMGSLERLLRFSAGQGGISEEIKEVLRQASCLELIGHRDVESLSDIGSASLKSLEKCVIRECNEMVSIIRDPSISEGTVFPALKELEIIKLNKLNCIWSGTVVPGSLPYLSSLTLDSCPTLTSVLSRGVLLQLQLLKHLKVIRCDVVKHIIEAETPSLVTEIVGVDNPVNNLSTVLPKLEKLQLLDLPGLVSIYDRDDLQWPSLEEIEINLCPTLTNLSLTTTNALKLVDISCNEEWWARTQTKRCDEMILQRLEPLCRFITEKKAPTCVTPKPPITGSSVADDSVNGSVEMAKDCPNNCNGGHPSTSLALAAKLVSDPSS